jgi:hypothetical protein
MQYTTVQMAEIQITAATGVAALQGIWERQEQYVITIDELINEPLIGTTSPWSVHVGTVDDLDLVKELFNALERSIRAMEKEQYDWFEFSGYRDNWKANRPRSSRADQLASYPAYQRIIGMGPERAVYCILQQMRDELRTGEPDHWFWALWALTGENPVPEENQGNIFRMAEAWISWGEREGYIDAEGVGGTVSAATGSIH